MVVRVIFLFAEFCKWLAWFHEKYKKTQSFAWYFVYRNVCRNQAEHVLPLKKSWHLLKNLQLTIHSLGLRYEVIAWVTILHVQWRKQVYVCFFVISLLPVSDQEIYESLERFSTECRKSKTKVITSTNHERWNNAMNQSEFEANTCNKRQPRENSCKLQFVLVLLLIGWENGARFF